MSPSASVQRQALESLPPAYFAVLDGAIDAALAATLASARLVASALYLEGGDPATVASGPLLVVLPDPPSLDRLIALPVAAGAVFWSWPGSAGALRHHLRSLNLVDVPADTVGEPGGGATTVLFRQWDPNVLAAVLPLLSATQQARLFGIATGLCFDSADHDGLVAITPPVDLPPPARGLLRFSHHQMAALSAARVSASRRRIASYLRETAPAHTATVSNAALAGRVAQCEGEAQALGLSAERDIARWSYLQVVAGGVLFASPAVRDQFDPRFSNRSPRDTLDLLFDDLERRLRGAG